MADLKLNVPIIIDGKEVILIEDFLDAGTDGTSTTVPCPETSEGLWIREEELVNAQNEFPTLPVYGVWQVLFHNGRVSSDKSHAIIYKDIDKRTGIWMSFADQYNGEGVMPFRTGYFVRDRVEGSAIDPSKVCIVDLNVDGLGLPELQVLSTKELAQLAKAKKTKAYIRTGLILAVIAVVALAVNWILDFRYQQEAAIVTELSDELSVKQDHIYDLLKDRIGDVPDYTEAINFVTKAYLISSNVSTDPGNVDQYAAPSFSGNQYIIFDENTIDEALVKFVYGDNENTFTSIEGGKILVKRK